MNSPQQPPATESIRIARPQPDERRIILLLTTEERKVALLEAARRLLATFQTRNMA